jgi:D-glycero-alpha-D-manno-heptose-7-phosphate kinase
VLAICPMERQRAVRESLADMREMPVKLDRLGSRVVLNVLRDIWG